MQQKILILDSNRPSIEALRTTLKYQGYEVISAYTVAEGEKRLLEKRFHLVLVDEKIVVKDGQKFLDFLRRKFPGLPGIVLIRQGLPLDVEENIEKSGFHLYHSNRLENFLPAFFDLFASAAKSTKTGREALSTSDSKLSAFTSITCDMNISFIVLKNDTLIFIKKRNRK